MCAMVVLTETAGDDYEMPTDWSQERPSIIVVACERFCVRTNTNVGYSLVRVRARAGGVCRLCKFRRATKAVTSLTHNPRAITDENRGKNERRYGGRNWPCLNVFTFIYVRDNCLRTHYIRS